MATDISAAEKASDWLPESAIENLRNMNDGLTQRIVEDVTTLSPDINDSASGDTLNCDKLFHDVSTTIENEDSVTDVTETENADETPDVTVIERKYDLTPQAAASILAALKMDVKTRRKWENGTKEVIFETLSTVENIGSLSHPELNVMYETMKDDIDKTFQLFKKSWKKDNKIQYISGLLGLCSVDINVFVAKPRVKLKSPASLSKIVTKVMASKKYPKAVLRCAYTAYIYPSILKKWQDEAPIPCPTEIHGVDQLIESWFSYPEINVNTGELLAKGIDCSHNFTHLRVRSCTSGLCGVSSDAWKACARSNETILKFPLVEDLIDKQSVPNARTNFCEDVEHWMRHNGYESAANLTRIIRNWYAASDDPGLSAIDRVRYLLEYEIAKLTVCKTQS
jgi:hypothetical protein